MPINKNHKPYKKQTPKPKPTPVYRLPSTNILHEGAGFVAECRYCGQSHPLGPLERMIVGTPKRMLNWCHMPMKPTPAHKITNFAGEYRLVGPIPPKLRAVYAASETGMCDDALTRAERKRAKATVREAARIERQAAAASTSKTQRESY